MQSKKGEETPKASFEPFNPAVPEAALTMTRSMSVNCFASLLEMQLLMC
jgi:hypothetical protein